MTADTRRIDTGSTLWTGGWDSALAAAEPGPVDLTVLGARRDPLEEVFAGQPHTAQQRPEPCAQVRMRLGVRVEMQIRALSH